MAICTHPRLVAANCRPERFRRADADQIHAGKRADTVIPMETTIDVGRIVVPKQLRDSLGMQPGTIADVSAYGAGLQVLPAGRIARIVQVYGRTVAESDTPVTDDRHRLRIDR